jgi:hypothetical protein
MPEQEKEPGGNGRSPGGRKRCGGRDLWEKGSFFDGGCADPGGGSFATASERSEHR